MKKLIIAVLLISAVATPVFSQEKQKEKVICDLKQGVDACSGRYVSIKGTKDFAPHTALFNDREKLGQTSIATEWGSVVLLVKEPIACEADILAEGALMVVNAECVEGTKCIPKELFLTVERWSCAE